MNDNNNGFNNNGFNNNGFSNGYNSDNTNYNNNSFNNDANLKFCKFCGARIPLDAVICTYCGRQVEELKGGYQQQPNIVINNDSSSRSYSAATNMANNMNGGMYTGTPKNKVIALLLCIFIGYLGAHKFYEGKAGMGLLYLFSCGLFGIGIFVDFIILLTKPSTYFV